MLDDKIKGVIVPIVTPLTPDEKVDVPSLRRLVDYLIEGGVHGIWAAGTTGEFAALTDDQRLLCIETAADQAAGRVPVIANVSAAATKLTVDLALSVREMRLDGIAATPPYYYPCGQDEIADHFRRISERVGMPLWAYNIPPTVKTAIEPGVLAALGAEGHVVGTKDSSGSGEPLAELNALCRQGGVEMYRFLGSVYRITTTNGVGVHGVIPGIGNLVPAIAARAWEAGVSGDEEAAEKNLAGLMSATRVIRLAAGGSGNSSAMAGLKSALKFLGVIDHDAMTAPLRGLTPDEKQLIPPILKDLGLTAA